MTQRRIKEIAGSQQSPVPVEAQTFVWGVRGSTCCRGKDIAGGVGLHYPGLNCTHVTGLKDVTLASQGDIGGRKRMNREFKERKREVL